jgi:hypothetical protein
LRYYLEDYWQKGVLLYVDGLLSTPEEVLLRHALHEDSVYMADFILNDTGKIIELRYDRVTKL